MNSDPRRLKGISVAAMSNTVSTSTGHLNRSTNSSTGWYRRMRSRLMGFFRSGRIRPRFQGKDGSERNGNHKQGVKQRRPNLGGRIGNNLPVRLLPGIPLQVFVGV